MARIDALPSIDIIRGFKGILDFYLWRGLPCVRAWPKYRPAKQTAASLAAALLFGAIIKAFSLTHSAMLEQLAPETIGIPRTARDIYVSGVYGNLHEASMSDFLDLLTECRDFLSNLQALLTALDSIDTDELVVNVDQSVLPPLAATTTNQATMITALHKLDDLQDALESKALDRLLVRGMDQVFSYKESLHDIYESTISGAGGTADSRPVPAGQVWKVTNAVAYDINNATTAHIYWQFAAAEWHEIHRETKAFGAAERSAYHGEVWLDATDVVRVGFAGALASDRCVVILTGHRMTLETYR